MVSKDAPLLHYRWGTGCDGWNLVEEPGLSVKQERMPPGTGEVIHVHEKARQFFFILSGTALFRVEGRDWVVAAGQGLQVCPGQQHRIRNEGPEALEFILCSQPNTNNDRINCHEKD
ncbi:MAG TPA: cupin domain-containing protein [Chitinophagaceae bacterium]|nr:cupin domain-containing protein [Chitinophagaceae bacterium]